MIRYFKLAEQLIIKNLCVSNTHNLVTVKNDIFTYNKQILGKCYFILKFVIYYYYYK